MISWQRSRHSVHSRITYRVRSQAVSTAKKSKAMMARAWDLRNSLHEGPVRLGAGPMPSRRRTVRIAVADTRTPSFSSSPDPEVALPRVLLRHSDDELHRLLIEPWPARSTMPVRPLASDEVPVPPEQDSGGHDERLPPMTWEEPAGGGEQHPVPSDERLMAGARESTLS